MKKDFQDIANSAPLNKTAALVTSKGEHWKFNTKQNNSDSEKIIPYISEPNHKDSESKIKTMMKFIGKKQGSLTVLGLKRGSKLDHKKGSQWVCKCACGIYTIRRTRSLKRKNESDACLKCDTIRRMREGWI